MAPPNNSSLLMLNSHSHGTRSQKTLLLHISLIRAELGETSFSYSAP